MPGIGGSSSSVSSVPISLQSSLNAPQTGAQNELVAALGGTSGTPQSIFPSYSGSLTAPLSALEQQGISAVGSAVPGAQTNLNTANQLQGADYSQLQNILTGGPQSLTGYYQTNVLQPLQQTLQQTILPDIMSASGGSAGGYQSTSQSNAIDTAVNNFSNTLAATQGQLAYQTGQQNIQNQLSAAGMIPTATQAPLSTISAATSGGGLQTAQQQEYLTNLYNAFLQQNQYSQQGIGDLLSYLGIPTQTPANQAVAQQGTQSGIGSLVQGLGSLVGVAAAPFTGGASLALPAALSASNYLDSGTF